MKLEGVPWCAVCGKPVERLDRLDSAYDCRVTFRVVCHGASETIRVDEKELVGVDRVEFGEAFREKLLPASTTEARALGLGAR